MPIESIYMNVLCLGILIISAYLMGKFGRLLHIGEVTGHVIGGLVAGPLVLFFIGDSFPPYKEALNSLHFFTFIFLSIIVFGIGDEIFFKKVKKSGSDTLLICIIQALATWMAISATFLMLGYKPSISFLIGSIGVATAPASTFVIMNKLGITGKLRNMLGKIVVLDDVIEVILFSITAELTIDALHHTGDSFFHIAASISKEFIYAAALGLVVFMMLRLLISRSWLNEQSEGLRQYHPGPEFLSRLISEMPGPSIEIFIIIGGTVSIGVGLALHWNLPFLITAVVAGILVSNFFSRQVFNSLKIENASAMYTLVFFALIGANADIEAFQPEHIFHILAYIVARSFGKIGGTWLGAVVTGQDKRIRNILPRLMLPQAGVAAIESFYIAAMLGDDGAPILSIIIPSLIFFEVVGIIASERSLMRWRTWITGGGEFIGEEESIRKHLTANQLSIGDLISKDNLHVPLDVNSKGEAIWRLISGLHDAGAIKDPGQILEIILERERQGGTTLGDGIAILHGRLDYLEEPVVALGVLPAGRNITFDSNEDSPIDIIYLVLSPSEKPEIHLMVLATIADFLSNVDLRNSLRQAHNANHAIKVIQKHAR